MQAASALVDVSITKSPTTGQVAVGSSFAYNITLKSEAAVVATGVKAVDVLPPGVQFDPTWTPPAGE